MCMSPFYRGGDAGLEPGPCPAAPLAVFSVMCSDWWMLVPVQLLDVLKVAPDRVMWPGPWGSRFQSGTETSDTKA